MRPTLRLLLALCLSAPILLPPPGVAQRRPKPVACEGGRFVQATPILPGATITPEVVIVAGGQVSLASGCAAVRTRLKATRKNGTKFTAKWKTCGTVKRVQLKGAIVDDCTRLTGTLKAKKVKAIRIAATLSRCGDGLNDVQGGEGCDDGNVLDCDGCAHDCARPDRICGDGIAECGESCDPPATDVCRDTCIAATCGDGITDPGEACDDGNPVNDDTCDVNCTLPSCPNGILNVGEQCDDGDLDNLDGCRADCILGTAPPFVRIRSPENGAILGQQPIPVTGQVQDSITSLTVNGLAATITGTSFTVANVPLHEGANTITAVATHATGAVGSDAISVVYDTAPPLLTVEAPRGGSEVPTAAVSVAGMVNDIVPGIVDASDVTVTVGGVTATVVDGSFLATDVPLVPGRNPLAVVATDAAGNVANAVHQLIRVSDAAGRKVVMVSGNEQSAPARSLLAPLVAQFQDADGAGVPNRTLRFRVDRGDGVFADGSRDLTATTDAQGRASVQFRLGSRAGVGLHRVAVSSPGLPGEVVFCQTALRGAAATVHIQSGSMQAATAGSTARNPFVVVVRDALGNTVPNAQVVFTRVQGNGTFAGAASTVAISNEDGRAGVSYTAGVTTDQALEVVSANLPGGGAEPAVFQLTVLAPGAAAATTFSGVVLDNANEPIPGTIARVAGANPPVQATTDAEGRFLLAGVTPGSFVLQIVGPAPFPHLFFDTFAISGRENSLPEPIYLPATDLAGERTAGGSTPVDVPIAGLAGAHLRVFPNSIVRGGVRGPATVSVTQVNQAKVPMPLPGGIAPLLILTIQPPDAHFDPPARLVLPNVDGLPPGFVTELYSFDHDLHEYVSVGSFTVSEDGSTVESDPGFGIVKGGWHGGGGARQPPPTGTITGDAGEPGGSDPDDPGPDGEPPMPNNGSGRDGQTTDLPGGGGDGPGPDGGPAPVDENTHAGGDDVIFATGELVISAVDLSIAGRGFPFELRRTYRSQLNLNGPLGHNWDFTYNEMLMLPPEAAADQDVVRCNGSARLDRYTHNPDGSYASPAGLFDDLRKNDDGTFTLRGRDGFRKTFNASGRLVAMQDRNGNRLTLTYDGDGRLATVVDTLGRVITFAHDAGGRLVAVTDFIGREVRYTYDARGDLRAVRSPLVTGTSTGNDFPQGKVTRYAYSAGFDPSGDPRLAFANHNLLQIIDAKNQTYLVNEYGTDPARYDFDRVVTQRHGDAGQVQTWAYTELNPGAPLDATTPRNRTVELDRNGNRRVYTHNKQGNLLESRIETNRDVDPDDPDAFVTTNTYDMDGNILTTIAPEGNSVVRVYDTANPERAQQGNVLSETTLPGPRGGAQTQLVRTYRYEPVYNQVRSITDPRGNDPSFVPPIGGPASAARYTTTFTFDYQEANDLAALATEMGRTTGQVSALLTAAGVSLGLGDVNGDGSTTQRHGNLIRRDDPTVTLLPGSQQAAIEGDTSQELVTTFVFNRFGQLVATTDPEGNVADHEYFPERDPDGDGVVSVSPRTLAADTGGYLAAVVRDARTSPRRREATPPAQIRNAWAYDEVGNVIRATDGRGGTTAYERNALDQVIRTMSKAPFNYERRTFYDANDNLVREEIQNVDTNGPGLGAFVSITHEHDLLDFQTHLRQEVSQGVVLETRFEYDDNQNQVRTIMPAGNRNELVFDERNLVHLETTGAGSPLASTRTKSYDRNGNLVRLRDAEDTDGDGLREETRYVYDGFDRLIETIDPVGNRLLVDYDPAGNSLRVRHFGPNGGPTPVGTAGAGNVLLVDEERTYDERNRVFQRDSTLFANLAVVGSDGPLTPGDGKVTSRTEFDRSDRVTRHVDDNGHDARTEYDGVDRPVRKLDALGNEVAYTYDANGNLLTSTSTERSPEMTVPPETFVTSRTYDALDRLATLTDSLGNVTTQSYDSRNNTVRIRDAMGNVHTTVFDGLNRRLAGRMELRAGGTGGGAIDTSNPANADGLLTSQYEWDENSRLRAVVDDRGNRTEFEYDALDRRTVERFADGATVTYAFDRDHNLVTFTDQNGNVTANDFDGLNRLIAKDIARAPGVEGTSQRRYEFDGASRLTRATENNQPGDATDDSVLECAYDSLGRRLVEVQNGKTVATRFDGVGNVIAVTYPDGRVVEATRDALDRVDLIRDEGAPTPIADYDYLGPARLLERRYGNGTRLRRHDGAGNAIAYDAGQRLLLHRHETAGGSLVAGFQYAYDRVHNRRFQLDLRTDQADVYEYDSAYRLTRAGRQVPATAVTGLPNNTTTNAQVSGLGVAGEHAFQLDGVGNWVTRRIGGVTNTFTASVMNEYATVDGVAQQHDENGNRRDDGTRQYVYDHANRLVRVEDGGGTEMVRYAYDVLGRRIESRAGGQRSAAYYGGLRLIEERDGTDATVRQYVFGAGLDELLEIAAGGDRYFVHADAIRSVVALTDDAGAVVERYRYDPYGVPTVLAPNGLTERAASIIGHAFRFTGQRFDAETDVYYYRARYYDPALGRFLQRDPAGFNQGTGLYAYAGNNPINFADPLGAEKMPGGGGGADGDCPESRGLWDPSYAACYWDKTLAPMAAALDQETAEMNGQLGDSLGDNLLGMLVNTRQQIGHGLYGMQDMLRLGQDAGHEYGTTGSVSAETIAKEGGRAGQITLTIAGPAMGAGPLGQTGGRVAAIEGQVAGAESRMIQAMDSTASVGTVAKVRPQGATLSSAQAQRLADMGDSIKVGFELKLPRGSTGVGELMDEYTMLANREVGIIRKADGSRVMRFGGEKHVPVRADERLIVHTHPSGNLKLSPKGIDPKTGAPTGDIAAMEAQNLHSTVIRDPWTSKAARLSRRTNKPCKTSEGYAQ